MRILYTAEKMQAPKLFRELELINVNAAKLAQEMLYYEYYAHAKYGSFSAAWQYYDCIDKWKAGILEYPKALNNVYWEWINIFILPCLILSITLLEYLQDRLSYKYPLYISLLLAGIFIFISVFLSVSNSIKLKRLDLKICFCLKKFIKVFENGYCPSMEGLTMNQILFEANPNKRYKPDIVLTLEN